MYVKVDKLRDEVKKYNDLITKYEDVKNRLYNEFGYVSSMWNDGNTPKFFDKIDFEKVNSELVISNMKSIVGIYSYIIESYESIGNEITVKFNFVKNLNLKFDKCISDCESVIKLFDQMSLKDIPEGYWYTNKRKDFNNIKKRIVTLKKNFSKLLDDISDIESEVKLRISHLDINIIKRGD